MKEYLPSVSVVVASTDPRGLINTTTTFDNATLLASLTVPLSLSVTRGLVLAVDDSGWDAGADEGVGLSTLGVGVGVGTAGSGLADGLAVGTASGGFEGAVDGVVGEDSGAAAAGDSVMVEGDSAGAGLSVVTVVG